MAAATTKKIDILNTRSLDAEHSRLLNHIASQLRIPFNELIEELSRGHEDDMDWWVSNLSSRNTLSSPLYENLCYLGLIDYLIGDGYKINKIVVHSKALAKIIKRYLDNGKFTATVTHESGTGERLGDILRPFYCFLFACFHFFSQYVNARKTGRNKAAVPEEKITLLDTFVLEDSFKAESFADRYYCNILDLLPDSESERIYYMPTFDKITNYSALFKNLRTSRQKFLLKEDFLKIRDYFYAFAYPLRMLWIKIKPGRFLGFDIAPLLKEEIYRGLAEYSSMEALLKYRFALRLKERNISIGLVIDWFENQVIDKGSNAGFRKFYSDVQIIGYQGFITSDNYLCTYPTTHENQCDLIPHKIAVIGASLTKRIREFCPSIETTVAPAFRFRGVWDCSNNSSDDHFFTILIAMPIMFAEGKEILRLVAAALSEVKLVNIRVLVKHHPANTPEEIRKKFRHDWPDEFEFVSGSIDEHLSRCNLVISSTSSVCMEALSRGMPVIIIGGQSRLTHNPIPEDIKEDIWALCYSPEETAQAILSYANRDEETIKRHKSIGQRIRRDYFEPVTRDSVRSFLQMH